MEIVLRESARRIPLVIDAPRPASRARTELLVFIAAIAVIVGLSIVTASVRITDRAVARAVEQREAPARFFAEELAALRLLAMTSASVVPARLYLGIAECFEKSAPVPFDAAIARHGIAACAEAELGRLHAQGGAELERRGRQFLLDAAVGQPAVHVKLQAGNFERR